MNSDNFKGTAKKVEGTVESAYGNVTNNKTTEFKGEVKKAAGDAQNVLGKAQDKVLDLAGNAREFINSASENLSTATDKVNQRIHENPVQSSFVALGIGFVLGMLLIR